MIDLPMARSRAGVVGQALIDDALETIRLHLGMPVAYLSRFDDDRVTFRNVSAPGLEELIKPGDHIVLAEAYCPRVKSGELPQLIPDTSDNAVCRKMPITAQVPIGSHVSLPVVLDDGEVYGMFCCLSPEPNKTLNARDLAVMTSFATLVTRQVQSEEADYRAAIGDRQWVQEIIDEGKFRTVFQPLVRITDGRIVGVEALSRFDVTQGSGPESIFKAAADVGLGRELELATLARQIEEARDLPGDIYLSLNASVELICDDRFLSALPDASQRRVVIEVTEHSLAEDEDMLMAQIIRLHESGAKIAIDDVGAGYSGLQRIAKLGPDMLKIDRSIVAGVHDNIAQRAIVAALMHFAEETGAKVLVEGVETREEAEVLISLGVELAQGWLFGRPAPLGELLSLTKAGDAKSA